MENIAARNIVQVEEVAVRSIHVFVRASVADVRYLKHRTPWQGLGDSGIPVVGEGRAIVALLHCIYLEPFCATEEGGTKVATVRIAIKGRGSWVLERARRSIAALTRYFAGGLVAEHAEASAENCLAGAEDVIGDADTRRIVEQRGYRSRRVGILESIACHSRPVLLGALGPLS